MARKLWATDTIGISIGPRESFKRNYRIVECDLSHAWLDTVWETDAFDSRTTNEEISEEREDSLSVFNIEGLRIDVEKLERDVIVEWRNEYEKFGMEIKSHSRKEYMGVHLQSLLLGQDDASKKIPGAPSRSKDANDDQSRKHAHQSDESEAESVAAPSTKIRAISSRGAGMSRTGDRASTRGGISSSRHHSLRTETAARPVSDGNIASVDGLDYVHPPMRRTSDERQKQRQALVDFEQLPVPTPEVRSSNRRKKTVVNYEENEVLEDTTPIGLESVNRTRWAQTTGSTSDDENEFTLFGRRAWGSYGKLYVSKTSPSIKWQEKRAKGKQKDMEDLQIEPDTRIQIYRFKKGYTLRIVNCHPFYKRKSDRQTKEEARLEGHLSLLFKESDGFKYQGNYVGREGNNWPTFRPKKPTDHEWAQHNSDTWSDVVARLKVIMGTRVAELGQEGPLDVAIKTSTNWRH